MRLRKRHAWGAVLIALFALPVLKPDGVAVVEEPAGNAFAWFAEVAPSPRLWVDDAPTRDDGRLHALEVENRRLWEHHWQTRQRLHEMAGLQDALSRSELDRLPTAVLARIVRAHDPVPLRRSILLDRGTADGVRRGQPVVMGGVYLGRVRVARAHSSLVQLVSDPRSRLEVFVRTSTGRLLRGYARRDGSEDGVDSLRVEFVRLRDDVGVVARGAPVFTSNADERVPAHLLVGTVTRVSDPDLDRMPDLTVRPALDLDRSTEVVVLLTAEARAAEGR
jgi:rod shape-determining protein MreC